METHMRHVLLMLNAFTLEFSSLMIENAAVSARNQQLQGDSP